MDINKKSNSPYATVTHVMQRTGVKVSSIQKHTADFGDWEVYSHTDNRVLYFPKTVEKNNAKMCYKMYTDIDYVDVRIKMVK